MTDYQWLPDENGGRIVSDWKPAKSIEQTAADYKAMVMADVIRSHDPTAKELYSEINEPEYSYPEGSNRDESRMCDEVSDSKSNRVMRGVLEEAAFNVTGPRQQSYGLPEVNHSRTSAFWSVLFGREMTPKQVCIAMALQKISREINEHNRDNIVDAIGYLANAQACEEAAGMDGT